MIIDLWKDEGLTMGDACLAEALWRNMYNSKHVDPTELERLVVYMRKRLDGLDRLPKEKVLSYQSVVEKV